MSRLSIPALIEATPSAAKPFLDTVKKQLGVVPNTNSYRADFGATLLRVTLGVTFLAHSVILKWLTFTLPGTAAFFEGVGLPGWTAYATFGAEVVGGAMLVLGIQARWVALALSPILIGAIVTVHGPKGWVFTAEGGGWEYPAYLFVLCLAQALLGDGKFALSPSLQFGFKSKYSKAAI